MAASGTVESGSFSLESYSHDVRTRVDRALAEYTAFGSGCPDHLREAIRYSLLAPGKRLRPMLVLMAAEACRGNRDAAMPAACAVEMIHTYSLIHDDLPAMDDDDLRRGRPTCHKAFGEGTAILAGDALLTLAFEVLARDIHPPAVAAECCRVLAQAAGATELVGGQADDLNEQFSSGQLETLESIHRRKTGAMFLVSLRLGALVAGAGAAERTALDDYGARLGLVFQITDDLLDVRGDAAAMGKRAGKDSGRGKLTFPGILGVEESVRRAERLVTEARAALEPLGPHAEALRALAHYVLERKH
ncbi:MAG: polyprenyl synthetase family protein [Planctomycetia bacterium]|nr:polyprenyl synthetase family protein [Planctomycetia bacterium]